ncbi:MAG: hypothetical protein ACTHN3_06290 [Solirubrobacterales bacterium]
MAIVRLALAEAGRRPRLWLNVAKGRFKRLQKWAGWFFLTTMAGLGAALGALALLDAADWVTAWWVAGLAVGALTLRWIFQVRSRVVIESFVDFTKEDAKAVSGLSTLLATELGRLRELYQQIGDLSVPTAVGVENHGGFGRGKEAGVFLTVSADDATTVLEDAVPADAGISVGPAKFSLKPILTLVNRVSRGPRLVGSVHLTEAGGGPTLTAQLLSKGEPKTWRIDQPREPVSPEQRKAFLDTMVRELACRMFSQLTLQGSVRPKAIEAFNRYLELYDEARRTPRDRAHLLKEAQGRLLKAVAEDEQFDLAYYNLGVINTQLVHTERMAEEESEDATSCANFDRAELNAARAEAARVAFERAVGKNPNRWEAFYALAVTRFSAVSQMRVDGPPPKGEREDALRAVVSLCDQALAVAKAQKANLAAVYDLRGMAQTRLGDFGGALPSHRKAVRHAWIEYYKARRRNAMRLDGLPDVVTHAEANLTAALHDLAFAFERRARIDSRAEDQRQAPSRKLSILDRLDLLAARLIFYRAARLAGAGNAVTAASRFERAEAFEASGKFKRAEEQFEKAALIHPRSAEYRARWAQALAARYQRMLQNRGGPTKESQTLKQEAEWHALHALDLLSQPFSLSVLPFVTKAVELRCQATLCALEKTYRLLGEEAKESRVEEMFELKATLEAALSSHDQKTGRRKKAAEPLVAADGLTGLRRRLAREDDEVEWETHPLAPVVIEAWPRGEKLVAATVEPASPQEKSSDGGLDLAESGQGEMPTPRSWQLDQVELAIGRLYADARDWKKSGELFKELVERLGREHRRQKLIEFGAYAQLARAQRECNGLVSALHTAAEGVRRAPIDIESRREAGRAHYALHQFSDALDAWEHALWISPGDPYLHYEMGMCYRKFALDQTEEAARQQKLDQARSSFNKARELFDGEDLDGEAWSRFWCGKLALEAGDPAEALGQLQGAEHGSATAAAALLLGETHLRLKQRPAADHAFERCEKALERPEAVSTIESRTTIDSLWGDELPRPAVRARIERGAAEAKFLLSGDWQNPDKALRAWLHLVKAKTHLRELDDPGARDGVMTGILETEGRIFQACGEIETALYLTAERVRYEETRETQQAEADLLDLNAKRGPKIDNTTLLRVAAEHAKATLSADGQPGKGAAEPTEARNSAPPE